MTEDGFVLLETILALSAIVGAGLILLVSDSLPSLEITVTDKGKDRIALALKLVLSLSYVLLWEFSLIRIMLK